MRARRSGGTAGRQDGAAKAPKLTRMGAGREGKTRGTFPALSFDSTIVRTNGSLNGEEEADLLMTWQQ